MRNHWAGYYTGAMLDAAGVRPAGRAPGYRALHMRPHSFGDDRVHEYKLLRRHKLGRGAALLSVGDQWWDFLGSDASIARYDRAMPKASAAYVVTELPDGEPAAVGVKLPESPV